MSIHLILFYFSFYFISATLHKTLNLIKHWISPNPRLQRKHSVSKCLTCLSLDLQGHRTWDWKQVRVKNKNLYKNLYSPLKYEKKKILTKNKKRMSHNGGETEQKLFFVGVFLFPERKHLKHSACLSMLIGGKRRNLGGRSFIKFWCLSSVHPQAARVQHNSARQLGCVSRRGRRSRGSGARTFRGNSTSVEPSLRTALNRAAWIQGRAPGRGCRVF